MAAISSTTPLLAFSYTDKSSSSSSTIHTSKTHPVEKETILSTDPHQLSINNAKIAYRKFRELAKNYYIACAGYRMIEEGNIIHIRIGHAILTEEYRKVELKQSKDLTPRDHDVIKMQVIYDNTRKAFEEFRRSAREDIQVEVIRYAIAQTAELHVIYADILDPNVSTSSTPTQTRSPLQILKGRLIVLTEKLEQQAAELFAQFVLSNEGDLELQREIVATYNRFLFLTRAVRVLQAPPEPSTQSSKPSKLSRAWKAFKNAF